MIIYLVGMYCVGKTTVGRMLAATIGFSFFDVNDMVEEFYQKPIERLQDECLVMHEFRRKASIVLDQIFDKDIDCVVAGTPAGLMAGYLSVYKRHKKLKELYSVYLNDTPTNILNRLTFLDKDSNQLEVSLTEAEKVRYLREIRADVAYFESSFRRADFKVKIRGLQAEEVPDLIIQTLEQNHVILPIQEQ